MRRLGRRTMHIDGTVGETILIWTQAEYGFRFDAETTIEGVRHGFSMKMDRYSEVLLNHPENQYDEMERRVTQALWDSIRRSCRHGFSASNWICVRCGASAQYVLNQSTSRWAIDTETETQPVQEPIPMVAELAKDLESSKSRAFAMLEQMI